jgi:hypothetical protein
VGPASDSGTGEDEMGNGNAFGGPGITPTDPNSAANDARGAQPPDDSGINLHSTSDQRADVNNRVQHTEGNSYLEVKGAKGELKIGLFLEIILGMKHTIIAGLKTAIDVSFSKTFNIGGYSNEMAGAKYEFLANKKEKMSGTKGESVATNRYDIVKGKLVEKTVAKKLKAQALDKELTDAMSEKVGPLLEATAARFKARAESVKEKIGSLDMKIASELRVKCAEARMSVAELDRHLSNIEYQCGKFERKCTAMDETVDSLMEIKGSTTSNKATAMKLKAGVLKFTGSMVKLGE